MKLYFESNQRMTEAVEDEILNKLSQSGFVLDAWYIVYNSGRPVKYSTEIIGPFSSRKSAYDERNLNWKPIGFNEISSVKKGAEVLALAADHQLYFDLNNDEVRFNWDPMSI